METIQESINNVECEIRKLKLKDPQLIELISTLDQMRQYINGHINKIQ